MSTIPRSSGTRHYTGQNWVNGVNAAEGHSTDDTCYDDPATPEFQTEPVDTFDSDYPDYDNNSYLDGYTDGATSRTDTLTIIAPTGLRFTLTVN